MPSPLLSKLLAEDGGALVGIITTDVGTLVKVGMAVVVETGASVAGTVVVVGIRSKMDATVAVAGTAVGCARAVCVKLSNALASAVLCRATISSVGVGVEVGITPMPCMKLNIVRQEQQKVTREPTRIVTLPTTPDELHRVLMRCIADLIASLEAGAKPD